MVLHPITGILQAGAGPNLIPQIALALWAMGLLLHKRNPLAGRVLETGGSGAFVGVCILETGCCCMFILLFGAYAGVIWCALYTCLILTRQKSSSPLPASATVGVWAGTLNVVDVIGWPWDVNKWV